MYYNNKVYFKGVSKKTVSQVLRNEQTKNTDYIRCLIFVNVVLV